MKNNLSIKSKLNSYHFVRVLTLDKTTSMVKAMQSFTWEKVMENNVDEEVSFNSDMFSQLDKALLEPYFTFYHYSYVVPSIKKYECQVNDQI